MKWLRQIPSALAAGDFGLRIRYASESLHSNRITAPTHVCRGKQQNDCDHEANPNFEIGKEIQVEIDRKARSSGLQFCG
jgi:hypothetical protein